MSVECRRRLSLVQGIKNCIPVRARTAKAQRKESPPHPETFHLSFFRASNCAETPAEKSRKRLYPAYSRLHFLLAKHMECRLRFA